MTPAYPLTDLPRSLAALELRPVPLLTAAQFHEIMHALAGGRTHRARRLAADWGVRDGDLRLLGFHATSAEFKAAEARRELAGFWRRHRKPAGPGYVARSAGAMERAATGA